MNLLDKLFGKKPEAATPAPSAPPASAENTKPKAAKKKSPKETATENGEPWVNVLSVEVDPDNIGNGSFELDWNEIFVARLVKAGYSGKTDVDIVDRWFQDVCRNVVLENFEQWESNQPMDARPRVADRKDLGDGRSEVS
jgi:hypothetical protein